MVYKSPNGLALDYLKSMFTDRSAMNCEGSRCSTPPHQFSKKSFSYNGSVMWNSLPTNLRQAQTIASCKSGCRGFLFDNK
ncbi:hypothetical protein pdam_00006174 [Pocillopora damicornis]|uniref:Uncharacterized protein n=1 Tax=Pocillopora damicornis TaxID=46731 RepID=A0A3M6UTX5_POCDA|nr:hypothetical protein pdam_00006174 [Pocillopora damicornis]